MGKKNKYNDYWEIEDDEALADAMYEYSKGDAEFPESVESGDFDELEKVIFNDVINDKKKTPSTDFEDMINKINEGYYDDDITDLSLEVVGDEKNGFVDYKYISNVPVESGITYSITDILNRMVIDDHIAPTSFSFDNVIDEIYSKYDDNNADDVEEVAFSINQIINYITSLKHPFAIYTHDEFVETFGGILGYNTVGYKFFYNENYVFAYVIDVESVGELHSFINQNYDTLNDKYKIYISLAYAAGRKDQVFFHKNENHYVDDMYHSIFNKQDIFSVLFLNDLLTSKTDIEDVSDDFNTIIESLNIEHIVDVQGACQENIQYVCYGPEGPYGDETEEDDAEEDNADEDVEEIEDETDNSTSIVYNMFEDNFIVDGTEESTEETTETPETVDEMEDIPEIDSVDLNIEEDESEDIKAIKTDEDDDLLISPIRKVHK